MRFPARTPVLVLLLLLCSGTGACSAGSDVDPTGADVSATGSTSAPTSSSASASTDADTTGEPSMLAPAVAAVCEPFARMVGAIKDVAFAGADRDEVAASIAPVMKEFASLVPELRRPPGLTTSSWRGVRALAERILALPDRPSYAEIEAVEGQLSPEHREGIEAAVGWFKTRCTF